MQLLNAVGIPCLQAREDVTSGFSTRKKTQAKRFDPNSEYIRKWIPQDGYYEPVVDLKETREAALDAYVMMRRAKRDK